MKFIEGHWYYNPEYIEIPTLTPVSNDGYPEREFDGFNVGFYLCTKDYDLTLLSTPYDRHGDSAYAGQLKGVKLKDYGTDLPKAVAEEYPEYAKNYIELKASFR